MRAILATPFLLFCFFLTAPTAGDDWPQFLGPQRNGISGEKGLIDQWPVGGFPDHWRVQLGEGMAGIAVSGKNLVTLYQDQASQFVVCLDTRDGSTKWQTPVAPRYQNSMGHGPRATPSIVDGKVYALTGEGILAALDLKTGQLIWSQNPQAEMRAKPAEYGMSGSPLVVGDQVIINTNPGNSGHSVCAYSRDRGKFQWGAGTQTAGYSSPMLFRKNRVEHILLFGGKALVGVDAKAGKTVWKYPFETEYNCNTASPVTIDGNILISAGENHGSALLELKPQGKPTPGETASAYQVNEKWTSLGRESVLRAEWQTPIVHDGFIYGFDNVGSASPITNLTCVEAATGKRQWQVRRYGKGNMIFADGKLIISTMKGHLIVARATPDGYQELGKQVVIGQTRQIPALSDGKIYLRDNREIVCLDLAQKK